MYTAIPQSGSPFPGSVQDPGLHVWRVEKLKPVPVARENQGVFFSGDSYLVLHNGPEEVSHLHLWIGQQSSRDEQGACAVLAVHLNTLLGERPVQHREVQGNESDLFMRTVQRGERESCGPFSERGSRIQAPGSDPGFPASLQNISAWCGGKSNILEHNKVEIVTDGEEPAEMIQVLGPKPALKEGNPEEDLTADKANAQAAALYKVGPTKKWDGAKEGPCSFLKSPSYDPGRKADEKERQAALQVAEGFISRMQYALNTQVEILPQGRESPIFKQFFKDWK
uniref:Gelsolin-like domain-containing protein n=1 Tax=Colobus angolensis palliatus TaxID=336983 RepID=A0A2K5JRB3_COLAP